VVQLIPFLRRADVRLISITGTRSNRLADAVDLALTAPIEREACPFNLAPTTSALVTLALCDTLAMLVQEEMGFTREQYRRLHPGGAIGDSLTLIVHDIMRTGDRLPVCAADGTVNDAVLAMTRCKAGAVGAVEPDGILAGIFTDGDLRRILTRTPAPAETPLREVMSPRPVTIRPEAPVTEAVKLFEQHRIDDLLVVDAENRLQGLVDLQDLPKLKVFKDA
jgi:arabinose-5-phosphate isomerase